MNDIQLDARLLSIARRIPRCENVADIGTDHGYLGAYLLLNDHCGSVQFLDISETSLRKAWRLCRKHHLLERASFSVGDGAAALTRMPDAVVIAGMGGQTIAGIVERGADQLKNATLILQPNVGAPELREALMHQGYQIVDEDIARAGNRWYVILVAEKSAATYTRKELLIGPVLLKTNHPNLPGYAAFRLRVAKKALAGADSANEPVAEQFRWEIIQWEAILDDDGRADD